MIENTAEMRIVLFEEHPLMILGLRTLLEKGRDTVVGIAGTVETLRDALREFSPQVAILDVALYSPTRYELLRQLHADYPDTRLVVLSVHLEEEVASAAVKAGASAYLLKTEAPDHLVEAVETVRNGRVYLSRFLKKSDESAATEPSTPIDLLTESELSVLKHVGKGYTLAKIARETERPLELVERDHWRLLTKLDLKEPEDLLEFAAHWVHHEGGF